MHGCILTYRPAPHAQARRLPQSGGGLDAVVLHSTNEKAGEHNIQQLDRIWEAPSPGGAASLQRRYTFPAADSALHKQPKAASLNDLLPATVKACVGAVVMYVANVNGRVNGERGIVTGFQEVCPHARPPVLLSSFVYSYLCSHPNGYRAGGFERGHPVSLSVGLGCCGRGALPHAQGAS